jgi:hypothetical protein
MTMTSMATVTFGYRVFGHREFSVIMKFLDASDSHVEDLNAILRQQRRVKHVDSLPPST